MRQHRIHGDFVRVAPNHISICHPAALSQIYSHKSGLLKGDFYDAFLQVRPVLFTGRDPVTHQKKKRYLNPAFSARALADFEPTMDEEMQIWKSQILAKASATESCELDFSVWTNYLAFDVIGRFAFGESFGFSRMGNDPYDLVSTIDSRGEALNALGTVPVPLRRYMKYHPWDSFWSVGLRATSNLATFGREAYVRRQQGQNGGKDLMGFLFEAKDPETAANLLQEEIVAEAISFIVGGSDTTSSTMTNYIDIVSRDKDLQRQIQEELDGAFPGVQPPEWIAPNAIVANLPLLNATLKEVMRFRPTSATGLERVVPTGGRVICEKFFPAGTVVSVPTLGIFRDERIIQNAERLDPQRWLEPESSHLADFFVPFSTGPRACIGRNFAWMEIVKCLATLFKTFSIERTRTEPTVVREGFFNKASECGVVLKMRRQ